MQVYQIWRMLAAITFRVFMFHVCCQTTRTETCKAIIVLPVLKRGNAHKVLVWKLGERPCERPRHK
jgi:hypothetical protein